MRLLTVIAFFLISIIPVSAIAARPAISEGDYAFAGFSDVKVQGIGPPALAGFQNACTSKFGSSARWASTKEMLEATNIPSEPLDAAWVRPIIADTTFYEGEVHVTDYSGLVLEAHDLSCVIPVAFAFGNGMLYFIEAGQFLIGSCFDEFYVACSVQE